MKTSSSKNIVKLYEDQLKKALTHLQYSYRKIQKLTTAPQELGEEELETWESFSSRFARVVDLFLTKFLKAKVLEDDPGFRGTLRDFVNQGEKLQLLENADRWMELRELRNIEAHTYEEDLERFLNKLKTATPEVLSIQAKHSL